MVLKKSISGKQATIGDSAGERLNPLDVAENFSVFEKCSKEQNPGQSNRNAFDFHADTLTLYGLAYARPYIARKRDCPLKAIEKLPFKQKVVWINGLSKEEKKIILEHNKACSLKR